MKKERTVYFPRYSDIFDLNNFVTSLLLYDKIKCSLPTFLLRILKPIPKKYHEFLLDLEFIEIWELSVDDSLWGWYDEMKCYFIEQLGYNEKEFEKIAQKLREKTHKYERGKMDVDLLKGLMMDNNGDFIGTGEYLDLYDAVKFLKTGYYATRDNRLLTSVLAVPDVHLDLGNNDIIFEINRFPDLSQDILLNNFNFDKFIALRDKEGAKLLREIIFKEENYNNPAELLQEYNDIILRDGVYSNKMRNRALWGLSNGLSIAGIFSGRIILTILITAMSILSGNHRLLYKSSNDKLEYFIKTDLKNFINSVS